MLVATCESVRLGGYMANGRLSRKELIREISNETFVRVEVVEVVLDSLVDIAIETLMKGDTFALKNLVTMEIVEEKGSTEMTMLNGKRILKKPGRKLRTKTSPQLRKLVKLQHNILKKKPLIVNRRTWKDALKWLLAGYASDYDNTYEVVGDNFFAEDLDNREKKVRKPHLEPQKRPVTKQEPTALKGEQTGELRRSESKQKPPVQNHSGLPRSSKNQSPIGRRTSGIPRRSEGGLPTNIER